MLVRALDQQQKKRHRESAADPQVPGVWAKKRVREIPLADREEANISPNSQSRRSNNESRHHGKGNVSTQCAPMLYATVVFTEESMRLGLRQWLSQNLDMKYPEKKLRLGRKVNRSQI